MPETVGMEANNSYRNIGIILEMPTSENYGLLSIIYQTFTVFLGKHNNKIFASIISFRPIAR
jgi:hypothetical protein